VILAEVSGPGVLEERPKKERKKEKKVESKNGVAYTADHAKNQILVAYGASDVYKRASRGCSSLHSAHT
jgi:hypothetical protein